MLLPRCAARADDLWLAGFFDEHIAICNGMIDRLTQQLRQRQLEAVASPPRVPTLDFPVVATDVSDTM